MNRTIALIGASGAGKSTVGRMLAARHDLAFTDVDAEIERSTGQLIREIFADHGEAHFRALERDATLAALARPGVVSLGGGAPMTPDIREALAGCAVVYLAVDVHHAAKRIGLDDARPLLAGGGMRSRLIRMLAERVPVYEALADLTVDTRDADPDVVADVVAEGLGLS